MAEVDDRVIQGHALRLRLVSGFSDGDTVSMSIDVLGKTADSHRAVFADIARAVDAHADLLAALEGLIETTEGLAGQQAMDDDFYVAPLARARLALAKAKGGGR